MTSIVPDLHLTFDSVILQNLRKGYPWIEPDISNSLQNFNPISTKLLYRGTRDGFLADDFHKHCDNKGPTLTILFSDMDKIFGAYTDISWTKPIGNTKKVEGKGNSFIFTFDNELKMKVFKCLKKENEVYHCRNDLIVLGDGHSLQVQEKMLGSCYLQSNAYEVPDVKDPNAYIAGKKNFRYRDIEVFAIELENMDEF